MIYYVSIAVDGRLKVEVDAENFEQAKRLAELHCSELDFNAMEFISMNAVNAERSDGVFRDY